MMRRLVVGLVLVLVLAGCAATGPSGGLPASPTDAAPAGPSPEPSVPETPLEPRPTPSPIPVPTPRCPSGLGPGEFPRLPAAVLSAARGDSIIGPVPGLMGSMIWSTCDGTADDLTPWLIPEDALDARQIDFLVLGLTNDYDVVSWRAFAVHADEMPNDNRTNIVDFGQGAGRGDEPVSFPAPPIGDWVVVVHATSISEDQTVVADSPYYFRVNVSAID